MTSSTSTPTLCPPHALAHHAGPPRSIVAVLCLMVATSGYVMREPAPTDVLFPALVGVTLLFGKLPVGGYGMLVSAGALLLALANMVSSAFAWLPLSSTMRYLAVTLYLLASFFVVAGLIAQYRGDLVRPLLRAYLFATFAASLIGILARFHLIPNPEIFFRDASGYRIKSTFKDPNVFAPFVAAAVIVALDDLVTGRRGLVRSLGLQVVYLLAILFAFSRGAFLNLAVCLAVYGFLRVFVLDDERARRRTLGVGLASVLVAVPVGLWALTASGLGEYFSSRLSFQGYDSDRFGAQREAFDVSSRHLLGIGPGNWTQPRFETDTHNVYLRVLSENGLLGIIGFLMFTLGSAVRGLAGTRLGGHVAGWCAVGLSVISGTLVESMVIDTLHWRHFFLFLALPVGLTMRRAE